VSGEFPAGSTLPNEDELCRKLAVSRTVIREATKVLTSKGMLQSRPRVGTLVRPREEWKWLDEDVLRWEYQVGPDIEFLRSLIEVRRTIEPVAAQLAALRATPDQVEQLSITYAQLVNAVEDQEAYIQADMTFHGIIFAACHNTILEQIARTIALALRASRKVTTRIPEGSRAALPLHADVMEAIAAHQPAAAEAAMQRIIDRAVSDIDLAMKDGA
jgi:DNA-binding FadR family transcriptional regulator